MNFAGTNTNTDDLRAIFDIHSGSVGAAIISSKNNQPTVRWATREPIDFLSEHDTQRLLQLTKQAVSGVADTVFTDGIQSLSDSTKTARISGGSVFISDPWHIGGAQEIHLTDEASFTVDSEQLQLAKKKARRLFQDEATKKYQTSEQEMTPLETRILQIRSNGYTLTDPIGLQTSSLSVHTHVSLLPRQVNKLISKELSEYINIENITMRSFSGSLQQTFTELFSHPSSFMIIDVDEEMTRIILIENGSITATVPFQLGSHFLIRTVSDNLDVPTADARTKIKQYAKQETNNTRLVNLIDTARTRWQDMLSASLEGLSANISIPIFAYVLAEDETSPLFTDFAQNLNASEHLITEEQFRIHEVTDQLFSRWIDDSKTDIDHYLGVAAMSQYLHNSRFSSKNKMV